MITQKEIDEWHRFPDEGHAPTVPDDKPKPVTVRVRCEGVLNCNGTEFVRLVGLAGVVVLTINNAMGSKRFVTGQEYELTCVPTSA